MRIFWTNGTGINGIAPTFWGALAVSLALSAALASWQITQANAAISTGDVSTDISDQATLVMPTGFSTSQIATIGNLFGIATINQENGVSDIPETPLDLTLLGTFSHSDPSKASALISSRGETTKRYFTGQSLEPGTDLVLIEEGYVVIQRNQQEELLKLPMLSGMPIGPEMSYPPSAASATVQNDTSTEQTEPVFSSPNADTTTLSLRDRLNALRNN